MRRRNVTAVWFAVYCFPFVAAVALLSWAIFAGGSAGGTLASGRTVTTHSDAWFFSSRFSTDTATALPLPLSTRPLPLRH